MEIVSLVISGFAALFSIYTFIKSWIVERRQNTIDAYIALQDDLYYIYEYSNNEIETFVTDRTSTEYKILSTCIAKIEIFATGVRENVYVFNTFYSMAHGYLDGTLRNKLEYILNMKSENTIEEFYQNTRWLLREMDKRN